MAVQTPISGSAQLSVMGDLRAQIAKFSSVANNDTYAPALGTIVAVNVESGNASSVQIGATWSGSTITFSSTGTSTNVSLVAWGY